MIRLLSIIDPISGEPPTEFRIFREGLNRTHKGDVLFDAQAAQSLLANAALWNVRLMIDLEHESLDEGPAVRADSKDARGWFSLEMRGGELWATNVEWTPDGERRIRERTQRYISPAFYDDEEGRPIEIVNAALCAMPATFSAQDLIAAKRLAAKAGSDVEYLGREAEREIVRVGETTYAIEDGEPREVVRVYVSRQLAARIRAARFVERVKNQK